MGYRSVHVLPMASTHLAKSFWGRSSNGRAWPSQGQGSGFKSPRFHRAKERPKENIPPGRTRSVIVQVRLLSAVSLFKARLRFREIRE